MLNRNFLFLLAIFLFNIFGCHPSNNSKNTYSLKTYPDRFPLGGAWKKVTIGNEMRTAIDLSLGEGVCFNGIVPSNTKLEFAFGIRSGNDTYEAGDYTLLLEIKEGGVLLFRNPYFSKENVWNEETVDLTPYGGKEANIIFHYKKGFWAKRRDLHLTCPQVKEGKNYKGRKNVILISLDTLRADHIGCYGYKRNTTPFLDEFAKKGVLFENCISSSSWTLPAHVSLMTSLYSSSHSVIDDGLGSVPPMLPTSIPAEIKTLAEILQEQGFETRAIVSCLYVSDRFGFDRGFNLFHYKNDQTAAEVTKKALSWLEFLSDRPFPLFLHYFDCHLPYLPHLPFTDKFDPDYEGDIDGTLQTIVKYKKAKISKRDLEHLIALYDGEIRYLDNQVKGLMEGIEKAGLPENTIIIITSDHGEEFKDHGSFHHGHTLFEELIRVPLLLFLPEVNSPSKRIDSQVRFIDIMPTILDSLGVNIPPGIEGETLMPCLKKGEKADCKPKMAYSETSRYNAFQSCMRTNEWKYIISDGFEGHKEALYKLTRDSGEKINLTGGHQKLVYKFRKNLFNNLDIVLKEQVCLRMSTRKKPYALKGEIKTTGRFLYIDSIGWWPEKTINLNNKRNLLSIHYPKIDRRVGINLAVDPPCANISFSDWTINDHPVEITIFQKGDHNFTDLDNVNYHDLLTDLITDPDLSNLRGSQILLFKTLAIIPRKAITEGGKWEKKKISEEDRKKLKALGYIW